MSKNSDMKKPTLYALAVAFKAGMSIERVARKFRVPQKLVNKAIRKYL